MPPLSAPPGRSPALASAAGPARPGREGVYDVDDRKRQPALP